MVEVTRWVNRLCSGLVLGLLICALTQKSMINYFFWQDRPRFTYKLEKPLGFLTVFHPIAVPHLQEKHNKQQAPSTTAPYVCIYCNTKEQAAIQDYRVTSLGFFFFFGCCLVLGVFWSFFRGVWRGLFKRKNIYSG